MPSPALIEAYRADLAQLTGLAVTDLAIVWRSLTSADDVRDALMDLLPELAAVYGSAAATLAADWYDEVRDADEAPGRFRAIPADLPDRGRTDSLARWGVGPLFTADPDLSAARSLVEGGFQRLVADAGRQTVIGSLRADPKARGWSRHTSGGCDFCKMIAGRGAVYSAETADFASHDNCGCVAVPVIGNDFRKVKKYTPSERQRNAKDDVKPDETRDVDADRTVGQLRDTLASLERSLEKFDSPGTRQRVEELRRKIAARS